LQVNGELLSEVPQDGVQGDQAMLNFFGGFGSLERKELKVLIGKQSVDVVNLVGVIFLQTNQLVALKAGKSGGNGQGAFIVHQKDTLLPETEVNQLRETLVSQRVGEVNSFTLLLETQEVGVNVLEDVVESQVGNEGLLVLHLTLNLVQKSNLVHSNTFRREVGVFGGNVDKVSSQLLRETISVTDENTQFVELVVFQKIQDQVNKVRVDLIKVDHQIDHAFLFQTNWVPLG